MQFHNIYFYLYLYKNTMLELNPQKEKLFSQPQKVVQNIANQFFKQLQGKTFNHPVTPATNPMKLVEYIKQNNLKRKSLDCRDKERFVSEDDRTKAIMQKRENLNQLLKKISKKLEKSQAFFQKLTDLDKLQGYEAILLEVSKLIIDFPAQNQSFEKQPVINIMPSPKCNPSNFKNQKNYQFSQEKPSHKIDIQEIRSRLKIPKDYHHYHPFITTDEDYNSKYLIDKSKLSTSVLLTEEEKKSNNNNEAKKQQISKQTIKELLSDHDPLLTSLKNLNNQINNHNQNCAANINYENFQKLKELNKNLSVKNHDKKQNSLVSKTNHLKSPRFLMERLKGSNSSQQQTHKYHK